MRTYILIAMAVAVGCTSGQQERKSDTLTAQEQATQEFQQAADAQKRAADEQAKAEKAQADSVAAQKAAADADARLRAQRSKAVQVQAEAQQLAQDAHQRGAAAQQQATQHMQLQNQQNMALNGNGPSSGLLQQVQGSVIEAQGSQLSLLTGDRQTLRLDVADNTALRVDGRSALLWQIQPGSDVRASYQVVDGHARALQVDVSSHPPPVDAR